MITKLLLVLAFFLSFTLCGQSTITFSYDSAGNQILRDRVVLKSNTKSPKDPLAETVVTQINDEEVIANDFSLVAYPNPVTNLLRVYWEFDDNDTSKEITLTSLTGQRLEHFQIKTKQGEQPIDFAQYPAGVYLLNVINKKGIKKTFKIIKK